MKWLIYGANGYTGKRIAVEAKRRGLTPVLAGRKESPIRTLAETLGLEWRAFSLEKPQLDNIDLVLHCAGPFSQTSKPLADALIPRGKHYLDITGEIPVFESLFQRRSEAQVSGSIVIPGVGFDVVPTDCLAAFLKSKLPDATHLELAMAGSVILSPGTLKSMIEGFGKGGWIRENGELKSVPPLHLGKTISFTHGTYYCNSIPWGDVSTAFYSTQIPNIVFYAPISKWSKYVAPCFPLIQKAIKIEIVQNFLKGMVSQFIRGPSDEHLKTGRMQIWGSVRNLGGQIVKGRMEVAEGYRFTVLSSLIAVEKILAGGIKPGVQTPSMAFGKDFIKKIPGTVLHV